MFACPMQAGMQMQRMLLPLQLLKQQQQLRRLVLAFEQELESARIRLPILA